MHPAAPAPFPVRHRSTWWWFLVPVLSFGLGTFAVVFIAAVTLKARLQLLAAAGYLLVNILYFGLAVATTGAHAGLLATPSTAVRIAAYPFLVVTWGVGTLHTVYLQWLAARPDSVTTGPAEPTDPAVIAATERAARRAEARRVADTDPALAHELKIGRPDLLGRQYDDGGLVDVNHVPAGWIALALRIPRPLADQIVAARDRRHGFRHAEELVIYCDGMTPERLAEIGDLLLFRPM
jgi:hypothetical protein